MSKNKKKNVKTKENEILGNIKEVLKMPYTSETMIKELKSCFKPLLKMQKLAKEYSPAIADFTEICATELSDDRECVEDNISRKVRKKSYINALKKINNNLMMLIGKVILSGNKEVSQLEKYIIRINNYIYYMYALDYRVASWLYDRADEYNSNSYITLAESINNAYIDFTTKIYQNYRNMKIEKLELQDLDSNSKTEIRTLSVLYDNLMNLATKVLELEEEKLLYEYKNRLEDFVRNMARILFYIAGQIYMDINDYNFIYSNANKRINKIIDELEVNVLPIYLSTLKYQPQNFDNNYNNNSLEYAYQSFKRNIKSLTSIFEEN